MATIQSIRTVGNPSRAYEWEVEVRGTSATGQIPLLVERAQSVSVPETAIDTIEIPYKGRTAYYAGRDASSHTLEVTFWDSEDHDIYRFMKNWMESTSDSEVGGGVTRDLYGAEMVIRQLAHDSTTATITHRLTHVFPTNISDVSLDYSSSEHTSISVTFSFDSNLIDD